jgi:hypothetical protein
MKRLLSSIHEIKKNLSLVWIIPVTVFLILYSCQKENSCKECNSGNNPPVANAGKDTSITLHGNSVILNGSASADPNNNITTYKWTKISGPPSFTIANDTAVQTRVSGLIKGMYQFELMVTDAGGLSGKDTVAITVNDMEHPNSPPIADAGADQTITLPVNYINLDGSASSDPDNNIVSYFWSKISGPSSLEITNIYSAKTQVINLAEGIYQFELKVTDTKGLSDNDTVQIEVKPEINQNLTNVIFYWPDPTGTVNFMTNYGATQYISWTYKETYLKLVTIQIGSFVDSLAGIWCQSCSPDCSYSYDWDKEIAQFALPPGTYNWSAETKIKAFPLSPGNNPGVTTEFFNFFDTLHKTEGAITVSSGNNCIVQKISFP